MESPRGNEFLKFFIGLENRSDSNREVPNVGCQDRVRLSAKAPELSGPQGKEREDVLLSPTPS